MTESSVVHHKIKAEWTKSSEQENYDNSSSGSDKLEIVEDESCETSETSGKIKILEQIVLYPSKKLIKCHYCDKSFNKAVFEEHQKIHQVTFFECPDCDKKFRRKSSLRKHSYFHKGKFKYECAECSVFFVDVTKFERHKMTKHKTDSIRYKCEEPNCEKSFSNYQYLKRHQVTHSDDYKYKCSMCDQKFKWMTALQYHKATHPENKTYFECNECYKPFYNQRTFDRHQKIHKNIKYKCILCTAVASNRKDNIRRHIRHLHPEVERSEISSKIVTIEDLTDISIDRGNNDNGDEYDDESADVDTSVSEPRYTPVIIDDATLSEEVICIETPPSPPKSLPIINNRVNVIQSVGNPQKLQAVVEQQKETPSEVFREETSQPRKTTKDYESEIKLPPKKKAIAISGTNISSTNSTAFAKPKYDPIQHYRKILLGFSKDEDPPTTIEDNNEEEEAEEEPQVFPIHWRKRTSQNFLFRH